MKLTLSEIAVRVERRYKLDESVEVMMPNGTRYSVYEFAVVERTYEYGDTERSYMIRGPELKSDGTPHQSRNVKDVTLHGPSFEGLPDLRQPFIDALNAATDEHHG